jgi:hypothetical protein
VPALCLGVGDIRKPFGFGRNVKVLLEVDAVRFRVLTGTRSAACRTSRPDLNAIMSFIIRSLGWAPQQGLGYSSGMAILRSSELRSRDVPQWHGFTLARLWGLIQGSPVEHHSGRTCCVWVKHQSEPESLFTSQ